MLALVLLLGATRWERFAFAVLVLLMVVVLHSGLGVLQCLIELLGVVFCTFLQVVRAGPISIDVRLIPVLPYALRYVAYLPVVCESGPLFLDGVHHPLMLIEDGPRRQNNSDDSYKFIECIRVNGSDLGDKLIECISHFESPVSPHLIFHSRR